MVKVKCKTCGETGYTAAPEALICKCGGRYKTIHEKREQAEIISNYGKIQYN